MTTQKGDSRPLSAGEISICQPLFKHAIDYAKVRVHNGEFLPFGLQDDHTAMTPNGELYFNPIHFNEDYSITPSFEQIWFMHEMVHVWQYQLGYSVFLCGMQRWNLHYEYTLAPDKRLCDYDMEAQGNLIADFFALTTLDAETAIFQRNYSQQDVELYKQVLSDFLLDPLNKANLPGGDPREKEW